MHYCVVDMFVDPSQTSPRVAFTAYATTTRSYSTGSIIDFPYAVTNIGSHYDTSSGIFTCPYDGLYLFTIHVMSDVNDDLEAEIVKESSLLTSAFVDDVYDDGSSPRMHASQMALTECMAA